MTPFGILAVCAFICGAGLYAHDGPSVAAGIANAMGLFAMIMEWRLAKWHS